MNSILRLLTNLYHYFNLQSLQLSIYDFSNTSSFHHVHSSRYLIRWLLQLGYPGKARNPISFWIYWGATKLRQVHTIITLWNATLLTRIKDVLIEAALRIEFNLIYHRHFRNVTFEQRKIYVKVWQKQLRFCNIKRIPSAIIISQNCSLFLLLL